MFLIGNDIDINLELAYNIFNIDKRLLTLVNNMILMINQKIILGGIFYEKRL